MSSAPPRRASRSRSTCSGVKQLYKERVKRLVIVDAGATARDAAALKKVIDEFPSPIVFCKPEVGEALPFPAARIEKDFAWAPAHPVVDAYRAYKPMPYDAPSHDLAATHYAHSPRFRLLHRGGSLAEARAGQEGRPDREVRRVRKRQTSLRRSSASGNPRRSEPPLHTPDPPHARQARRRASDGGRLDLRAEVGRLPRRGLPRRRRGLHPEPRRQAAEPLLPRAGRSLTANLPDRCVLDGEIVIVNDNALDFDLLQLRLHPAASRVKMLAGQTPSSFVAFDLLCLDDRNLCPEPFEVRRRELESALKNVAPPVHLTPATRDLGRGRRLVPPLRRRRVSTA